MEKKKTAKWLSSWIGKEQTLSTPASSPTSGGSRELPVQLFVQGDLPQDASHGALKGCCQQLSRANTNSPGGRKQCWQLQGEGDLTRKALGPCCLVVSTRFVNVLHDRCGFSCSFATAPQLSHHTFSLGYAQASTWPVSADQDFGA